MKLFCLKQICYKLILSCGRALSAEALAKADGPVMPLFQLTYEALVAAMPCCVFYHGVILLNDPGSILNAKLKSNPP